MTAVVRVHIRPARLEDAQALADLATQLGYPTTAAQCHRRFEAIAAHPDHAVFAAEAVAGVIGWVHVFIYRLLESDRVAEIGGLVVDEGHREAGIGRQLMARAEAWARQQGCTGIYVRSNVVRERAHRFYASLGFTRIKTQYALLKPLT